MIGVGSVCGIIGKRSARDLRAREGRAHLRPGSRLRGAAGPYESRGVQIAERGRGLRVRRPARFLPIALGEYAGFLVGWSDWISTCGTTAAVTVVIAESSPELLPVFGGSVPALAATVAVALAAAQWRGIRQGSLIQNVTSVFKGAVFAALIISAFLVGGTDATAGAAEPSWPRPCMPRILLAFKLVYTYDGCTLVV